MIICKQSANKKPHILYIKWIYKFLSILVFTWFCEQKLEYTVLWRMELLGPWTKNYAISELWNLTLIVVLPCILISTKLFYQQMHLLLKHKMLQIIFKISFLLWFLHVSVPSDHHQGAYDGTLPKLVSLKSLVKIHS